LIAQVGNLIEQDFYYFLTIGFATSPMVVLIVGRLDGRWSVGLLIDWPIIGWS
jgi:hypothetical protein